MAALAVSDEVLLSGLHLPPLPNANLTKEQFKETAMKREFFLK